MKFLLLFQNLMPNNAHLFFGISFSMAQQPPVGHELLIIKGLTVTRRHTTVGRTPLDEWSARRRDLYLKTHNTRNRRISMPRRDSKAQSQQASGRRPTP